MRILIVNDDGIRAKGLITLANTLKDEHEVTVIAPDKECSGWSHFLHFQTAVSYTAITAIKGCLCYMLDGTPCDCAKFGIELIMRDNPPDIVLSGINNGINAATDVIYSGTVNAAIEAGICGCKAIAISQGSRKNEFDFTAMFIKNNIYKLKEMANSVLSINVPSSNKEDIQGIRYTSVGVNKFNDEYIDLPKHGKYGTAYMLTGEEIKHANSDDLSLDINALWNNYISITPIKPSFTDYSQLRRIDGTKLEW